jgi:hypothetical protein
MLQKLIPLTASGVSSIGLVGAAGFFAVVAEQKLSPPAGAALAPIPPK